MLEYFSKLLSLRDGEDSKSKILDDVKSNVSFRGANLWILACAIMVASVGLNVNSTAVVIGAMLISPLMGPIVGAGFALGTYDHGLLKKSLRNLLVATVASLIVSSLYFLISPFKEPSSELLARTSPNLYDVLIAFFGGLAGAIAITRIEKGNPIAGVAIATALMPPLCTAGYGLATGHYKFFFGAMFLYTINCVFICISTFVVVKYLHFPSVTFVDKKSQKRITNWISIIILALIIPSSYFAFVLYREQQFREASEKFINDQFLSKGNTLVYKKLDYSPQNKKITLAFLQKNYDSTQIEGFEKTMKDEYGLSNTALVIRPNINHDVEKFRNDILNEVSSKDKEMAALKTTIKENTFDNKQLINEIRVFFPEIEEAAFEKIDFAKSNDSLEHTYGLLIKVPKNVTHEQEVQLKDFAERKYKLENVRVIQFR